MASEKLKTDCKKKNHSSDEGGEVAKQSLIKEGGYVDALNVEKNAPYKPSYSDKSGAV